MVPKKTSYKYIMKNIAFAKFCLFILANILVWGLKAQDFVFTFEPEDVFSGTLGSINYNAYEYLEFDKSGLWQIGHPAKDNWDSAYRGNYALMTDTTKMINYPTQASFIFKFECDLQSQGLWGWSVSMAQLFDLPVDKAGIYLDVSYNEGQDWIALENDTLPCIEDHGEQVCPPAYYLDYWMEHILDGYKVASGVAEKWGVSYDDVYTCASKDIAVPEYSMNTRGVWIRFNYKNTDTVAHKGWIIDDLQIQITPRWEGLNSETGNKNHVNLFPNPIQSESALTFNNESQDEFKLEIFNMLGKLIYSEQTCRESIKIVKGYLGSGTFIYTLTNNNKIVNRGKILVE